MVYCINVYLDSFNNIYLIKGYVNFYIELKHNLLPLIAENSGIQLTKLYISLQTRQKCYVSFWLYFTPCYNSEKKPLPHKVRAPSGFVNVMPYVRSILRVSFFFPIDQRHWMSFHMLISDLYIFYDEMAIQICLPI